MTTTTTYQLGAFLSPPLVNVSATSGDQYAPTLLSLAGGGYVAAYVNASGALAGGNVEFFDTLDHSVNASALGINPTHAGTMPSPIALAQLTGGLVVAAWAQLQNDGFYHVAYQKYDAQGVAQGGVVVLADTSSTFADIALAATSDGGFMVSATSGANLVVHGHVANAGTFSGFSSTTTATSSSSDMATLANGNVVMSFTHGTSIEYNLFDQNSALIHSGTLVTTAAQSDVIALGNGGFAIAYEHTGAQGGSGIDIGLDVYDAFGALIKSNDLVNDLDVSFDQHGPALALDGHGDLVVAWSTPAGIGGSGTMLRYFDQAGNALGYDQLVDNQAGGAGTYAPAIIFDYQNDLRIAVESADTANTTDASGTHIQRISGPSVAYTSADNTAQTIHGIDGIQNLISGSPGDDVIYGQNANIKYLDVLLGNNGNDSLIAGSVGASLEGGNGDDALYGNTGNDSLYGGGDNDTLYGGAGHDYLDGGDGNDTLVGNADIFASESDTLYGGNGDDMLFGEVSDFIDGGAGTDDLYAVNSNPWNIDLGATNIEWMQAGFGNDTITAASQSVGVTVYAGGGNDVVTGSGFADTIWAGYGNDTVDGGAGDDVIIGDVGADSLSGGDGNDSIYTDGVDTLLDGGNGTDALYITGGLGMNLNLATSHFEWVADYSGANDTVNGSGLSVAAVVYGGGGLDTITGGSGADFLWGEAGNDVIVGGAGDDTLVGGANADTLTGGLGNDNIFCNSGGGGDGAADTVIFNAAGWGTDFVYDFEHGLDKLNVHGSGATLGTITLGTSSGNAVVKFGSDQIIVVGAAATFTTGDIVF